MQAVHQSDSHGSAPPSGPARHQILFENGRWWICDGRRDRKQRICALFRDAGWRVDALGERLGFSRRTLDRIVEDSLGIPAKRWLRELRFRVTLARLREGCRVKELAAELGFQNASELTREFVSFWGVPPSRFVIEAKRRNVGGASSGYRIPSVPVG